MTVTVDTLTPFICRARRRLAGLTVAELADRLGWPVEWIAEFEGGDAEAISKRSRAKLADALEQAGAADDE
jgi:transcriptional regulator with XRE-family HTH domain